MASVKVEIILPDLWIPNTFTPNGDGINDVLKILINATIRIRYFRVYNRWGKMVFITSDATQFWDGFKENVLVPGGVYYWVLEGDYNSQKKFMRAGFVTVIR